jgi:hypothetical protein
MLHEPSWHERRPKRHEVESAAESLEYLLRAVELTTSELAKPLRVRTSAVPEAGTHTA